MKIATKIKLAKIYLKLTFIEFPRFIRNARAIPKEERSKHIENLVEDTKLFKETQYDHVRENVKARMKKNPIFKGFKWEEYGLF